ncbi:hypothetical protein ARAM_007246 [Aspergillus rambellii]|uniref:ubiquitinyl hydrolase 1 n=1 Tax=Aspergillus rambellii TaxID=308745 RepID=A0A0F8V1T1_9EURO|nr:hypothetical protein ARAM_007246 [Aspergillus rambellii]
MAATSPRVIEQAFNHIVLPARTPNQYDRNVGEVNRELILRALRAVDAMISLHDTGPQGILVRVKRSLELGDLIHDDDQIDRGQLIAAFAEVEQETGLMLHVTAQNAGLLVQPARENENGEKQVIVECFEASPTASSVLSCTGALNCDYPGTAVAIPMDVFTSESFQQSLAAFLDQASGETVEKFAAKTKKAGVHNIEHRDTAAPHLITQMLMVLLESVGSQVVLPLTRKRIRDEVSWHDAYLPWRRSPFYLVVRVCVERLLYVACGPHVGRFYYKMFICMIHFHLLLDSKGVLPLESRHFLLAKLCRRLAKLETQQEKHPKETGLVYFREACSLHFSDGIQYAAQGIEAEWSDFKRSAQKRIPILPARASDRDTRLQLPNSAALLKGMLSEGLNNRRKAIPPRELTGTQLDACINQPYRNFAKSYSSLHRLESQIQGSGPAGSVMADAVERYLDQMSNSFNTSVQEKSIMMLYLFEQWILLDQHAIRQFPLLAEYSSVFLPKLLDVLQLTSYKDMKRLCQIQEYLDRRQNRCRFKHLTLFSHPVADGFSDRYVRCSPDAQRLKALQETILTASQEARLKKKDELTRINSRYRELDHKVNSMRCERKKERPWSTCSHCHAKRKRKRLVIEVHEDYLPGEAGDVRQRAVIFEIAMPDALAKYRDATWRMLSMLGIPENTQATTGASPPVRVLLDRYPCIQPYIERRGLRFHLASRNKSFLVSHYKGSNLPVSDKLVLLPCGLDLAYYDTKEGRWASDLPSQVTFAHHFSLDRPVLAVLKGENAPEFAADGNGRSSYEIITTQGECPAELTVHEYTTYQSLLAGKSSRWLSLLRELGSSNLNFSLESTMHIVSYLALQAGPSANGETLRTVHRVFNDPEFCSQLATQIEQILSRISRNWREAYCMEMLLTLILRIWNLGSAPSKQKGAQLVHRVRLITSDWFRNLRLEIRRGVCFETAQRLGHYALLAGILCKRTFAASQEDILNAGDLQMFLEACITIQENLQNPSNLSETVRGMLVRDLRMTFSMEATLRDSLASQNICMQLAIESALPEDPNGRRVFGPWRQVPKSQWWMEAQVTATESSRVQFVHYHPLEGHLLLDQKPIGKLPSEIRDSSTVQDLFGQEHLLIFPSAMVGMSYTLASLRNGHQIHFGQVGNEVIIKALAKGSRLRLVNRHCFGTGAQADLPFPLISNCFHWLDLRTQQVEIRRRKHSWILNRPGNWVLDVRTRQAARGQVRLVDPHSHLFSEVAAIFQEFEDVEKLTVFQPRVRNLSVELKRMDLDFTVNAKGLLVCRQLHAEIDPDQDAGTWYGLQSKIILRDSANPLHRSVIVPIGPLSYRRQGPHVLVMASNDGRYGRYQLDSEVGRLKCEPEPLLVYTKSLLHAFTSFPLPDPLTGRSGTEEALACLTGAMSQPWNSLGPSQAEPLIALAQLTPKRDYYPREMKRQQKVFWDENLTVTIQHDQYRPLVERMAEKLNRLAVFSLQDRPSCFNLERRGVPYLTQRSYLRRRNFGRSEPRLDSLFPAAQDQQYGSRDKRTKSLGSSPVYEVAQLLRHPPTRITTTPSLAKFFGQVEWITGYSAKFQKSSINELMKLNIPAEWGQLVHLCRQYPAERYDIMFKLAIIALGDDVDMGLLRVLVAFCILPSLQSLDLPAHAEYSGFQLPQEELSPESIVRWIEKGFGSSASTYNNARLQKRIPQSMSLAQYTQLFEKERHAITAEIREQWPYKKLHSLGISTTVIDINGAIDLIADDGFLCPIKNSEFAQSLRDIQTILDRHVGYSVGPFPLGIKANTSRYPVPHRSEVIPDISSLLLKPAPLEVCSVRELQRPVVNRASSEIRGSASSRLVMHAGDDTHSKESSAHRAELRTIIDELTTSPSTVRREYGENLMSSLDSLERVCTREHSPASIPTAQDTRSAIEGARNATKTQLQSIRDSLSKSDMRHKWLSIAHLWPCLTPVTILEQLRSSTPRCFGRNMKQAFVAYGVLITRLQQVLRIHDAVRKEDAKRLREEHDNGGHENWDPEEFPDWLLMEIDAGILIRKSQVDVARATISPASGSNSVLQMNMGQGKTSVVTPIVLCALADGGRLVRLLVPESLLLQTAQTLQARLGGLVGREVLHIPFARRSPTEVDSIREYRALHEEIRQQCGVILTLPQHVLSFRLNGFQCVADSRLESAKAILSTSAWMGSVCRDVIDECDFSLAVKTQLIYPSGSQFPVDGHPQRWKTAHVLLSMIEESLAELEQAFPSSIEVVRRPHGSFPIIHILRPDVEQRLHQKLVDELCFSERHPISFLGDHCDLQLVGQFISQTTVQEGTVIPLLNQSFGEQPTKLKTLFLLRGLIGHGILLLCLKKRWNVQYGLHPGRSPIAVPFLAKGVPSEQAEWGHPDVAIVLTCLAFYYNGLSQEQLSQCFRDLSQSDDPPSQYNSWISHSDSLPPSLRHWNLINVDDDVQMRDVWQHLRYVTVIINYFLDHNVFPVHATQFSQRLQMSAWDLPLFNGDDGGPTQSDALTTGFSGTNDDRFMLPLTIQQKDLSALSHTNAEVLTYLLHPRNRSYEVAAHGNGKHLTEIGLLHKLHNMGIRTLIDAGAHILELSNRDLVRQWLSIDHQAPAAIYFDAGNKPWVVDRNETEVPLLASSFANDLGNCLVYLDEAHTRGTDLKFPPSTQGALTVSLGQTKDHTVQAAMRLRQLGTSQSIVFLASPEAHQSILDHRRKMQGHKINSTDVISWLLEQTCRNQEQLKPLYLNQGYDFCRRIDAQSSYGGFLTDPMQRQALMTTLMQREHHALEELYAPQSTTSSRAAADLTFRHVQIIQFAAALDRHRLGSDRPVAASALAFAEVEQERELMTQVQDVRDIQPPVRLQHCIFPGLHGAIKEFALHGRLAGSQGYEPAFTALQRTATGRKYAVRNGQQSRLYVSMEFTRTVKIRRGEWLADFLRPVHWILWSPGTATALVIIPEEVECLIPLITAQPKPVTHLLVYAAPVTKEMIHFNSLGYYAFPALPPGHQFPALLLIELGILAGRLFFSYEDYTAILKYLGQEPISGVKSNGNALSSYTQNAGSIAHDALGFLQEWLSMTRKGREFGHTPMGYICRNRQLERSHALFADGRVDDVTADTPPALSAESFDSGGEESLSL